jgi:hypothetical protein
VLSTVPTFNTLAGIGPDDQALVPIELVELPGKPTEKGMQTVHPEDAETNRRPRIPLQELAVGPPPPAPPAASVTETMTAAPPPPPEHALAPSSASSAAASAGMAGTNGAASKSEAESSWSPPPLTPPPPSPEPAFAKHNAERPEPVEPALSTVPGATLPPRRAGSRAVLGIVVLLAAAGGLAIYFGLSGSVRTAGEAESANRATSPGGNAAGETTVAQELPSHAQEPKEAAQAAPRKTATPAAPGPTPPAAPPPTATGPGASPTTASPTTAPSPTPTPAAPPVVANPRPAPSPSAPATPSATPSSAPPIAGAFEIISTPPGAALFVDGEPQGVTPAQLPLTPGAHKLVVAGEGQMLLKRDVEVKPGARLELTLDPAKLPAAVAGSAGLKVRCKSHGEVRIFVDGADSGRGCPNDERIAVAPGPHKIGLYSVRTGEMHEVEHEVTEGDHSTRVYVKY